MTPERYQHLRDLYHAVCDLHPNRRDAYLAEHCANDAELRKEVESLLSGIEGTDFLSGTPFHASTPDTIPERFGQFRVIRLLGEGGMGCVYEAEQAHPNRRVALKVIRPESMSTQMARRFELEVEALGQLRHPGIAQIYDAGAERTPSGRLRPYLAMELVRGRPLTEFIAERSLSIEQALTLVARIADAVQHAHQRGVIHRDLKPANIMVEDGTAQSTEQTEGRARSNSEDTARREHAPKILDFGIARLAGHTASSAPGGTFNTEAGQILGTLSHMAPEQFSGDPIAVDSRCDIYAIGVIAYELLAGKPPLDLKQRNIVEAARIIESEAPQRLGTIDRRLRGDAEIIVAKAMSKEPAERYESAAALAEDIRRTLRHEPIVARPASTTYQLKQFFRRNRGLVVAGSAALVALVAGLIVSTSLYVRAEKARRLAASQTALSGAVRDYLVKDLLTAAEPQRSGPDVKMLDVLLHASEGLHERFATHPEIEAELRLVLGEVLTWLGKFKEGEEESRAALALYEPLEGPDSERTIAALMRVGIAVNHQERHEEAERMLSDAVRRADRSLPESSTVRIDASSSLGECMQSAGKTKQAEALLTRTLEMARRSRGEADATLGPILSSLSACLKAQHRDQEAAQLDRQNLDNMRHALGPRHPDTLGATNNLINSLGQLKQTHEAALLSEGFVEALRQGLPEGHALRGIGLLNAASAMRSDGNYAQAERIGLMAWKELNKSNDELNWLVDRGASSLRATYISWPGHGDQAIEWCGRHLRIRLMNSGLEDGDGLAKLVADIEAACSAKGVSLGAGGLTEMLWEHRDVLADPGPPGHRRRSMYLANLARVMAKLGRMENVGPSLELAQASVGDADSREQALALIQAVRSEVPAK